MARAPFASWGVVFLVIAARAEAQRLLRSHVDGDGAAAAALADLDGDAVPDDAVSISTNTEGVEVLSGKTGARIRSRRSR